MSRSEEEMWRKWKAGTAYMGDDGDTDPVQNLNPEAGTRVSTTGHPSGAVAVEAAMTPEASPNSAPTES